MSTATQQTTMRDELIENCRIHAAHYTRDIDTIKRGAFYTSDPSRLMNGISTHGERLKGTSIAARALGDAALANEAWAAALAADGVTRALRDHINAALAAERII